MLFSIFISDIDNGIGCALSKFVGDSKMTGAADSLREVSQRDPDRLEGWAHESHKVQ